MVALQERAGEAFRPPGPDSAGGCTTAAGRRAPVLDRPLRRDALPEHTRYVDSGCNLHPSCLTCPLVRCRYDEPGGARKILSQDRDGAILRLRGEGKLTIEAVALRFGVSRRTVFRVLARARDGEAAPC